MLAESKGRNKGRGEKEREKSVHGEVRVREGEGAGERGGVEGEKGELGRVIKRTLMHKARKSEHLTVHTCT